MQKYYFSLIIWCVERFSCCMLQEECGKSVRRRRVVTFSLGFVTPSDSFLLLADLFLFPAIFTHRFAPLWQRRDTFTGALEDCSGCFQSFAKLRSVRPNRVQKQNQEKCPLNESLTNHLMSMKGDNSVFKNKRRERRSRAIGENGVQEQTERKSAFKNKRWEIPRSERN